MNTTTIWFFTIAVMAVSFVIQRVLQSKFEKYSQIMNPTGVTGADVARKMLEENGIDDVTVDAVEGNLTDHYNPQTKRVNLSRSVYYGNSVAAAAVAAHECGHAIQHKEGYGPLRLRSALVPVVNFANMAVQWVLLAGVLLINIFPSMLWIGIALFAVTTLFSVITLPVEINASRRALQWLESRGGADGRTLAMASDALKWAAYTYVVAALGSLGTLFYYVTMANQRR